MKKIYLIIIASIILFSSCSDFLDETPRGERTPENYYKTEKDAVSATNAIYDCLIVGYAELGLWDSNYGGVFYNDYWVMQDLFTDNAHSNLASADYQSIDKLQMDQYNLRVQYIWRDFYQTIKAANIVINKVPDIDMNADLKKQLLAEAHFFRAMMYFDLVRMFGDVPLRTKDVESPSEENIPRTDKEEIYELIISDLKIAEADLKYNERLGGGRPYSLSASALLARVYLTYGALHKDNTYYQLAIDKAKLVIPSFPMMNKYEDIFKIKNRFNSEIIYGVNFSATLSAGWKGAQFLVRMLPKVDKGPDNAQGWETATEDLYNAFLTANDDRKDVTLRKEFLYEDGTSVPLDKPYFFKYWDQKEEPKGNNTEAIFPLIRTSEMHLIIAEASNEMYKSPNTEAVSALKAVRDRVNSTVTIPTDYAGFRKAVLNENRLEFAMEGHRWFDLTRVCTPEEFATIIKAAKPSSSPVSTYYKFPIPQYDRELSQGVLTQNDGY